MNAKAPKSKVGSFAPIAAAKLHAPLARMLRPLVRLCIRGGMTFPALTQLLRELYVNVAEHDFALEGKEQTDSRVSLLTGIHRKEVARLRGAGAPVNAEPATLSRTSAIIARWLAGPEFTDAKGEPLPLPRTADGGAPSFETLVESITKDVRPRAVLEYARLPRSELGINRRQKLRSFLSRCRYGGDLHRRKRWCNLFRCPCLSTPGKHQAGRYSVATRNLSHLRARCQCLLDNPCLVVLRPAPPPL
ncbi:hypothetical protein J2R76_000188 [Bradyrhizobium sp. USDA 4532]|nr:MULTISPECIES: DUF6502 family protein [unclassified Bradyrhizobium]MCP1831761.1 hypothetical protein [Bradyrhizobium sp. USDA 4545]MCP1916597.1 hypothetical protein [Bradyrhizobium sp. USDA 4532]